jgi:hypothetical protein
MKNIISKNEIFLNIHYYPSQFIFLCGEGGPNFCHYGPKKIHNRVWTIIITIIIIQGIYYYFLNLKKWPNIEKPKKKKKKKKRTQMMSYFDNE